LAVEGEYITGAGIFATTNDGATLKPFLEHLKQMPGRSYRKIVANAGYESEENYAYTDRVKQRTGRGSGGTAAEMNRQKGNAVRLNPQKTALIARLLQPQAPINRGIFAYVCKNSPNAKRIPLIGIILHEYAK
jgi:hypothetical protein